MEDVRFRSMKDEVRNVDELLNELRKKMREVIGVEMGNKCFVRDDYDEKGKLKKECKEEYEIEDGEEEDFEGWIEGMLDDGMEGLCYDCDCYEVEKCRVKELYSIYDKVGDVRYDLFERILKEDME